MSKGLEALEMLKNMALSDLDSIPITAIPICEKFNEETMKNYENLKQALLELKHIKEAEPSEALKCVGVLKEEDCITTLVQGKALETIRQYILKVQEQEKVLKALEIIKTKRVDIPMFYEIVSTVDKMFARDRYNQETNEKILTQEEFDLLKEVLECQKD